MVMTSEVLAIVPARGGSKGIPRKNIRDFAGYPLIAYSIAAGLKAKHVRRVIVSTDDAEIAEVARKCGAETPFLRPPEISGDLAMDLPAFQHALNWLAKHEKYRPDIVVQLRPTSPIRPPDLVDRAVEILLEHADADSVRGVVPAGQNPHKMWRIDPQSGRMQGLLDLPGIAEPYNAPRQTLPPVYWQTGHIDAIKSQVIVEQGSMSGRIIYPVLIDNRYTVDIDTQADWQRYEHLVMTGELEMVDPGMRRPLPEKISLVVLDFDGVMTDDRVHVREDGSESVTANRSDGLGLRRLRDHGIKALVISTETNPVVKARCEKLALPFLQGVDRKAAVLENYLARESIDPAEVVYLGNDINDLECIQVVGCGVAVADAHPLFVRQADMVLSRNGGFGAVRELSDLIIQRMFPDAQVWY